ncbi:MAG: hypothetical protein V3T84_02740 [Phycisphaerales bacterium]
MKAMNAKRLAYRVSVLVAITIVLAMTAASRAQSSDPDKDSDRFVITNAQVAISRPNSSWEFEFDSSQPPVVARMKSTDSVATIDIQVQEVPSATLDLVLGAIEQAIAAQVQDFTKLSGQARQVNGLEVHDLVYTGTTDGMRRKARILVCKPDDTLYVVKCTAPLDEWDRFEEDFEAVIASFELLSAEEARQSNSAPEQPEQSAPASYRRYDQDPNLNNLVHPDGYEPCALGELGRVTQIGSGPRDMILIAGGGFGGDIYNTFMESHKDEFMMYAITLAGFGGTPAPPMPPEGTSYGEQTWTKAAQTGLERLIRDKQLDRPIVVAHWVNSTQVALRLAIDNPDMVSAVILISGVPRNLSLDMQSGRTVSLQQRIDYMDKNMAPLWFKTVTRDTWDDNNYYPHDYAIDPVRALQLWRQAAEPTLPVWVRYLCESQAQDVTLDFDRLTVPTLVLKPGFDEDFYFVEGQNYMELFCHQSWDGIEDPNKMITMKTIEDSRVFIVDDQPERLDQAVDTFLAEALK